VNNYSQTLRQLGWLPALLIAGACLAATPVSHSMAAAQSANNVQEPRMWIAIHGRRFAVTLADSTTARAFAAQLPLTMVMEELNGNEKHARLPTALPADAKRQGIIRAGDIMLYGDDTLVVFYAGFHSNYSYTRMGRVDDPSGLAQALGPAKARITFSAR
jgi:hypothetical protein